MALAVSGQLNWLAVKPFVFDDLGSKVALHKMPSGLSWLIMLNKIGIVLIRYMRDKVVFLAFVFVRILFFFFFGNFVLLYWVGLMALVDAMLCPDYLSAKLYRHC